jgi:hypothetical protein
VRYNLTVPKKILTNCKIKPDQRFWLKWEQLCHQRLLLLFCTHAWSSSSSLEDSWVPNKTEVLMKAKKGITNSSLRNAWEPNKTQIFDKNKKNKNVHNKLFFEEFTRTQQNCDADQNQKQKNKIETRSSTLMASWVDKNCSGKVHNNYKSSELASRGCHWNAPRMPL